ncbi:sulfotransferase family 2 domain-containing protein [Halomonas stenophila]|uniref:Sulfotransferase family protein n=1 Tax=Halomonas stenophila TaxID=795312 RepID=A0A7W5HID8_9GAMM|nr:sulfotransferase family 2 domain-containing protein [Halomonas stenophila]MBB3229780.1 hypothetical protein [Halomonas stenophila]
MNSRQLHFKITVNGRNVSYLYIRKNACSSWKKFFAGVSPYREHAKEYQNLLGFMGKYHKIKTVAGLKTIQESIIVVREPAERLFSGFVNQYLMRLDRRSLLHESVEQHTGKRAEDVTFHDFLYAYVTDIGDEKVDAHFWSQRSHMADVRYHHVWPISQIHGNAKKVFGEQIADRYFLKKSNSTHQIERQEISTPYSSSRDMFDIYEKTKELPKFECLVDPSASRHIKDLYSDDYALYERAIRG